MKKDNYILVFTDETELHIGDYFRAYRSKYFTKVKDIAYNQRNYEDGYGEYSITMVKIDIYNKQEELLASDSIVPIDKIISGALAKYIPDLKYDPTYLGNADPFNYPVEHKIWRDMIVRCFDCTDSVFPFIGAVGTTVCDRWKCFEYFLSDFKHIIGYAEAGADIYRKHYIVDLYDIQKHVHPSKRIYAPGYVKLKPFKESDICRYYNLPSTNNTYPRDYDTTMNYRTGKFNIKDTLFKKQTGMNVVINLDVSYYYNSTIGYQPIVSMINPYMSYTYNMYYNPYYQQPIMKEMCTIIRKE